MKEVKAQIEDIRKQIKDLKDSRKSLSDGQKKMQEQINSSRKKRADLSIQIKELVKSIGVVRKQAKANRPSAPKKAAKTPVAA